jgi:uncharacterized protein (DUF302 family)
VRGVAAGVAAVSVPDVWGMVLPFRKPQVTSITTQGTSSRFRPRDLPPLVYRVSLKLQESTRPSAGRSPAVDTSSIQYGFKKSVALPVDEADRRLREELKKEGFGILTEIDVRNTLKEKLDVEFRPYKILGACNPPLAHQALTSETDIGLLLPCNVVVYEGDDADTSVVGVLDPRVQLGITGRDDIDHLADEVRARMERVLDAL